MSRTARRLLFVALAAALAACSQQGSEPDNTLQPDEPAELEEAETEQALTSRDSERTLHVEGVGTPSTAVVVDTIVADVPTEPGPAPEAEPVPADGTITANAQAGEIALVDELAAARPSNAATPFGTVGAGVGGGGNLNGIGGGTGGLGSGSMGMRGRGGGRAAVSQGYVAAARIAPDPVADREQFEDYGENEWTAASEDALATFSIDVDTASYSLARSSLNSARLPQASSIRVEEFVNVFDYGYAPPEDLDVPFSVDVEAAPSHFGEGLELLRIGIQGYETDPADRAPANLVFLVDTSGSMRGPDRLGLVQYSLDALLNALGPDDTLAIVTYSGRAEVLLPPTRVVDRPAIREAIDGLQAGGGTNGADGIRTAYELAQNAFADGGTNRVIWCSDGDLNVGMTGDTLLEYIEDHGRRGVALTTLGFGRGNYNDRDMERFANRGDGNYHFIDDRNEALRVLGDEMMGTLEVIARDVKIQVEVNDALVESYRLIGYENRDVADADFRNDAVDAGEIGSGHSVTALLELDLRDDAVITRNERLATVRVRYEMPDEEGEGREIEQAIWSHQVHDRFEDASASFRLAAAVAEFAEVLRGGESAGEARFDEIERVVRGAQADGDLQVEELAALVSQANALRQ